VVKAQNVAKARTNQNEEFTSRLNMQNAWYSLVQNLLSSQLLSNSIKVRIYKTIILSAVLYDCETWTLTIKEEHILRAFDNWVLRNIFEIKREKIMGNLRKLCSEQLHELYSSLNVKMIKSRRMRYVAHKTEKRKANRDFKGKPEGKRPLGRPTHKLEDNIKMDLK
jgi:hypothetical protein